MTGRADPLGGGLDLASFKPRKPDTKVPAEAIRKVAEAASFPSREALPAPEVSRAAPPTKTERRIYRTGRNAHFSCKVTQDVENEIYRLTDELAARTAEQVPGARWTVGMTIERMVAALRRELDA